MKGRILIVDDEPAVRFTLRDVLEERGLEVLEAATGEEALAIDAGTFDVAITDLSLPGIDGLEVLRGLRARDRALPVIVLTARGSERIAVRAMKEGAHDYLTKPFDVDELSLAVERALELASLRVRARTLELERALGRPVIGDSPALRKVIDAAIRLADRDVPVLITGETGTGKELLAGILHAAGRRSAGPLVRFNCAAIPAELAEAELFGHAKGAFTGAGSARRGFFAEANGGTIVLDEVGDLPAAIQPKLLRVLQDGEIQPVGTSRPEKVDIRVVASTHRDLRADASAGRFREDLYYRLAVVELRMPPLRERREDVPALARAFAARAADRFGIAASLDDALVAALEARAWPGNVRELEATVTRMVALSEGGAIGLDALDPVAPAPGPATFREQVDAFERDLIARALADAGGNQSEAARRLGMARVTLIDRMKRLGLA